MKNVIIVAMLLVIIGYAYYDYNKTKEVVTVTWKEGRTTRTVDVINSLRVSRGDTVLLEVHSYEQWGHSTFSIPQIGTEKVHIGKRKNFSVYYRMIKKKEKIETKKIEWVTKGTPSNWEIQTRSLEGSHLSIIEKISIKKGVVIKRRAKS